MVEPPGKSSTQNVLRNEYARETLITNTNFWQTTTRAQIELDAEAVAAHEGLAGTAFARRLCGGGVVGGVGTGALKL
jgi:hypothetical protein